MSETSTQEHLYLPEFDDIDSGDVDARSDDQYEASTTTITIPLISGAESVVVDEQEPGTRDIASLTVSPRRAKFALIALAATAFATAANEASIVALSSAISSGLNVPVASVGLLATVFAITVVLVALPLTAIAKRWSKRTTLTATLVAWTTGLVIAATADTLLQLAAGRIVSAAAHALFWALVAPTAASMFAPHLRGQIVTRVMVGAAAAGVIGTPLVAVAGTTIGWQAPYWGLAGIGLLLAGALALTLPRAAAGPEGPQSQARGDVPSMGSFVRVLVVTFAVTVAMTTTWTYIIPFYTQVAGVNISVVPVLFAVGGILAVAATLGVGRFLATHAVECVLVGTGLFALAWVTLGLAQTWSAVAAQLFQSAGWAVLIAALLNWTLRHTPWTLDTGASTFTVTVNAGAAIGPMLGAGVVATFGTATLPWVSLALTAVAAGAAATADRHIRRRLHVSRQLRMALQRKRALDARRREWQRRTHLTMQRTHATVKRPLATTRAATVGVGRGALSTGKAIGGHAVRAGQAVARKDRRSSGPGNRDARHREPNNREAQPRESRGRDATTREIRTRDASISNDSTDEDAT